MSIIIVVSEVILVATAGVSPFYLVWRKLYVKNHLKLFPANNNDDALRLQKIHGYNEHSLVGISGEKLFWLDDKKDCAVSYNEHGKVWIVAGEPLASEKELIPAMREFLEFAETKKKIVAFLPVTERFARLIDVNKFDIVKIGATPYFDLQNWKPRGDKAKHLRAALNSSKRAEISVQEVSQITDNFNNEVLELSKKWIKTRRAGVKFSWLFDLNVFENSERKKFFAARVKSGKLVGVLAASPIPAREGWYLEDILRAADAPNGTTELLVSEAFRILASQGAKLATLGTVPLSEKDTAKFLTSRNALLKMSFRFSRKKLNSIYNFEGLQRFKSKFVPSWWEGEYAVTQRSLFSILRIVIALFYIIVPGGVMEIIQTNLQDFF